MIRTTSKRPPATLVAVTGLASLILTACGALEGRAAIGAEGEIAAAKVLLTRELRDPTSAQFREVTRLQLPERSTPLIEQQRDITRTVFCGEINARNAYGGMTGFVHFYAVLPSSAGANDGLVRFETIEEAQEPTSTARASCVMARPLGTPQPVTL